MSCSQTPKKPKSKPVKMRKWLILLSYSSSSFLSGAAWAILTPIPSEGMSYFSISPSLLTLYSYSFFITCIPLSIPSSYQVARSLHKSLHLIWISSLIGTWIRVLSGSNFWLSFLGQLVISSSCMLMLTACSTTASLWFPKHQLVLATSIGASSNFVGMGFSFLYMSYRPFIAEAMWGQALFASFFWLFNLIVSVKDPQSNENYEFWKSWKQVLRNWDLATLACLAACGLATNYAVASVIGFLMQEQGYDRVQSGWIGFIYAFSGLVGGLVATGLAEVQKSVRRSLVIVLAATIASSIGLSAVIRIEIASYLMAGVFGATLTGSLPLCIRICVEAEKEIHDSIPTNLIYFIAQIFSCLFVYPIQFCFYLTGITGMWAGSVFIICSYTLIIFFLRKQKDFANKESELLTSSTDNI